MCKKNERENPRQETVILSWLTGRKRWSQLPDYRDSGKIMVAECW